MKSPDFSLEFVSHGFVQRLPLSGGLDQTLVSFWNPLNLYFKLKGEKAPVKALQEHPSVCPAHSSKTQGVRAMLVSSVMPATTSAMTNLPGRGWHEAPAMLAAPAVGTPVNTLWGSLPCYNTPWHPFGSSQKRLRWARLDGTAWLPLVYDHGDCFNAIQEEKKQEIVYLCGLYSLLERV